MKAIVCEKYGPPNVLQLKEVETLSPEEGEVLVKIHAASVNYGDAVLVSGKPFISRLMGYGLFNPKYAILGGDVAGHIEVAGGNTTLFHPGDAVFGDIGGCGFGAYAEYVSVPETALTAKPTNLTFEQAAAVPQAAVVALQGLRDRGQIQPGQRVLINGASGGVGTFAVQIARALGTDVTGVCSARNQDMVRSIGAERVIDYTQEDFTQSSERYDLIFDIVADRPISAYMRVLTARGVYVACAFNPAALFVGPLLSRQGGKQARSLIHKPNPHDLLLLKELIEAGQVVPVIDRCYPLAEVGEAMRHIKGSHTGKVVIAIAQNGKGGS